MNSQRYSIQCPKCGKSENITKAGFNRSGVNKRQIYECMDCQYKFTEGLYTKKQ